MGLPKRDFEILQAKWYEQLRTTGFVDVEAPDYKTWRFNSLRPYPPIDPGPKQDYYRKAYDVLRTYPFKNSEYKKIWQCHAEGLTVRKIEALLHHWKKSWIHVIIQRISREVG
jgi:hypothetical protein